MPRAFIAILLSPEARDAVTEEVERLRPLSGAVAWVPRDNLHHTLRFLGEQGEERLADALAAVETTAAAGEPFTLGLHGLGAFPGLERPRILWVGVAEGALAARGLQARLEAGLAERGFPPEARPWHPHLTVGRVFDDRRWRREVSVSVSRDCPTGRSWCRQMLAARIYGRRRVIEKRLKQEAIGVHSPFMHNE
jgi:2'-5' RNA ligase